MTTDAELLRSYVCERSEGAFSELVRRHINLVYSAALRETHGDAHRAEDIAQAVFAELAGKASGLVAHPALAGWLYTCVRRMAANARRADDRRHRREREALAMNELLSPDSWESVWRQIQPVLDDAMHELNETDRAAVVLRFFEDRSLREIGLALGINENAARMRVDRALEKLHSLLAKRGITSTAAGLTATITAGAVVSAPAALTASVAAGALAGAASVSPATFSIFKLMTMTKLKAGIIGAVVVAGMATPWVMQHQTQVKLREENQSMRRQLDQMTHLQAENEGLSNLLARARNVRSLTADQLSELMKLRAEVGALRKQQREQEKLRAARGVNGAPTTTETAPEVVNPQTIPRESWAFAGYATPAAAFQSVIWAMSKGDLKSFLAGLGPQAREMYGRQFEGKTESEISAMLTDEIGRLTALRLDRKKVSAEGEVTFVLYSEERDDGTAKMRDEAVMTFKNTGSEWRLK